MAARRRSPKPPRDPVREHLVNVRRGLLRLHKTLVDAERVQFERQRGELSSGRFLQALIDDPQLAWLRVYSGLIVEIDEALAADEPLPAQRARAYIEQVRSLVLADHPEGSASRYETVRERSPEVLLAQLELTSRIRAALE